MKQTIQKIICLAILLGSVFSIGTVEASSNLQSTLSQTEYSQEYKEWLELTQEERSKVLEPRKYDVGKQDNRSYLNNMQNAFKAQMLLRATIPSTYNLKNQIASNVAVKDQMQTNTCWAFASIGALESHLALQDQAKQRPVITYNFSERHMNYATARSAFVNGQINPYGFTKGTEAGGSYLLAQQYLTNGMGAVKESDLPFQNNSDPIEIGSIQNKKVETTVEDTAEFETVTASNRSQIIAEMKEHIANYGGLYVGIHGADVFSDSYRNETGAIYCNNAITEKMNHAVTVIGWDDEYEVSNFNPDRRPSQKGAWIVKNSWGESLTESISKVKEELFKAEESFCIQNGWSTASQIPTEIIMRVYQEAYGSSKVKIEGNNIVTELGDKGYMYVSYEDCNVYKNVWGIKKAEASKNYDHIYQHDLLGPVSSLSCSTGSEVYLANVFNRNANLQEELTKISIYSTTTQTCKVYVNPNGNSKAQADLQEVELQEETVTIEPGYHTIEFAEPVPLKGSSFVVVVKIMDQTYGKRFALESKQEGLTENAEINAGESFYTTENSIANNEWVDLGTMEEEQLRGNLCIKAFTNEKAVKTLAQIDITQEPAKKIYQENENFDPAGMIVRAKYTDNTTKTVSGYTIVDGTNLALGKTNVTIRYTENGVTQTTKQAIQVVEKENNKVAVNSNFEQAKSKVTEARLYFNSKDIKEQQGEMTIKLSGIRKGNENNQYTYYYYVSEKTGEENIEDWKQVSATKEQDGTYSITFVLYSNQVSKEVLEADQLYLYVKEVAKTGENTAEKIVTSQIENTAEVVCYVDGKKVGSINDVLNQNQSNNSNQTQTLTQTDKKSDNTMSNIGLPRTGITAVGLAIVVISMLGSAAFYQYKHIDR